MNFEAAMVVFARPAWFSEDDRFAAADFVMKCKAVPAHIQMTDCDFQAMKNRAFNMANAAFHAIRCSGRWPK